MTGAGIREIVDRIKALQHDPEAAHGLEDALRRDFIEFVASGEVGDAVALSALATEVMETGKIFFPRWTA